MVSSPDNEPNKEQSITHSTEASKDQDIANLSPELLQVFFEKSDTENRVVFTNPSTIETLAQKTPDALIKFVESSDQRQYQYHLNIQEQRHKESLAKENTTRLILGGIFSIFIMCFIYAAYTKDQSLPNQVFNVLLGGAGGAGLITTLNRKKD